MPIFLIALGQAGIAAPSWRLAPWRRGRTPTTGEAEERVIHLREFGPTPYAFTLKEHFPLPDVTGSGPIRSPEEWTCPA